MPAEGSAPMRIGFVGLGNMGGPMAARLLEAGHDVVGFDLSPDAVAALTAAGGEAAAQLGDVARGSAVIILMLPNSTIVERTVAALIDSGELAAGTVVVDMSSSTPMSTRALAETLRRHGPVLVDAPVSGGVAGARSGKLTIMVGGEERDTSRVEPILSSLGRVVLTGPVGSGHAAKALNNLVSATHLWATSEAMTAGMAFGLDPATLLAVFNGSSGRSGSSENKWPNFILPGSFDSGFGLALMLKDMRIAVDLAENVGAPSVLGSEAVELWAQAADDLPADADHTEVARWIQAHASGEHPEPTASTDARKEAAIPE
jgi:3-hydroxyisobutyrate dehydrogenase